jgi:Subtilase family
MRWGRPLATLGGVLLSTVVLAGCFGGCFGDDDEDGSQAVPPRHRVAVDELVGENWVRPGVPPPHQNAYGTPNAARVSTRVLWAKIVRADPVARRVIIALKPSSRARGFFHGTSLISPEAFRREKAELLRAVPGLRGRESEPIRLANGTSLPVLVATVRSRGALDELRTSSLVDFVEPFVVLYESIACGADPYTASSDRRATDERLPGLAREQDLVPYVYGHHRVREAWGALPGDEQGIAILDTGVSEKQQQFFSNYSRFHNRRPHLRLNTTNESINDSCSHGTKMASIAAAPRDGRSVVGIAWNAPLTTIKVTTSPFATRGTVGAICDGISMAVSPPDGRPPARVVAMAFGLSYFSPTIAECIATAFRASPRTVFVAAAGSNVTEVVFPANFDPFVVAVSMVELAPSGPGYRLMGRPLTVAYGPEVDFVSVTAPNKIPASGFRGDEQVDEIVQFGQSSAATAVYAGIVALAGDYAQRRRWTRPQLLAALRLASSKANITDFSGEPVQAIIGSGIVDAYRATGGARRAIIRGPYQVRPNEMVTLSAETDSVIPPGATPPDHFEFSWRVDGSLLAPRARTLSVQAPAAGRITVELFALDTTRNASLEARHEIDVVPDVAPPVTRTLFWTSYVADWATFLNGGRHDRIVNAGVLMPQGCVVQRVRGLLMANVNGEIRPAAGESPQVSIDRGSFGFTVSRVNGTPPNSLEALVHQWHDGFSGVRTKVVYDVLQPAGVNCEVAGVLPRHPAS